MEKHNNFSYGRKKRTAGDVAVDGLLAGVVAGLIMLGYLLLVALVGEEGLATMLGHFAPGPEGSPLAGTVAHVAVSGIYGALFSVAARLLPGRPPLFTIIAGVLYGLLLLWLAVIAFLPGAGLTLAEVEPFHLTMAHLVYGVSLAWLSQRNNE